MKEIIERESARKNNHANDDDDADFDLAILIASRYRLPPHLARLVVRLAGLGRDGSATA